MSNEKKPEWLSEIMASAKAGEANAGYCRSWAENMRRQLDAERGPQQPLTEEDNLEIQRLLDQDRRGPLI